MLAFATAAAAEAAPATTPAAAAATTETAPPTHEIEDPERLPNGIDGENGATMTGGPRPAGSEPWPQRAPEAPSLADRLLDATYLVLATVAGLLYPVPHPEIKLIR